MTTPSTRSFSYDQDHFLRDGKPFPVHSGEIHYFRVPREYWRHRLQCARAMGLNTVSSYMPWNLHEPSPGKFDFSGRLDVAHYIRLAQEEGLCVILRPGPYICSEWDMGGLPSWLLATPDIRLRCNDPRYMAAVERYINRAGQECAPLLYHRGGPIAMVQVENEYGAFANDRVYMAELVKLWKKAGFDGLLFTCDWAYGGILKASEVYQHGPITVANFGTKGQEQIGNLRKFRPNQPAMCGEFWCGWFDLWGQPRTGSAEAGATAAELKWFLENNVSFNFYMFHGCASFGPMSGANLTYKDGYTPMVSSYDWWSPIDVTGRPTKKFFAFRDEIAKHAPAGAPPFPALPEPPFPLISVPKFELTESVGLLEDLPKPIRSPYPQTMESWGQSYGLVLYRTAMGGMGSSELRVVEPHDYAKVYFNGQHLATLDRRLPEQKVKITNTPDGRENKIEEGILEILVDTTGRVNFGSRIVDRKGISERVEYGEVTLMNWEMYPLPLDEAHLARLKWRKENVTGPAFHRGTFNVETPGETHLDMRPWGRGMVWVNGHNLGRFWKIGPQQTLYVPGAWLRQGSNDIVVFDVDGTGRQPLAGLEESILDQVRE